MRGRRNMEKQRFTKGGRNGQGGVAVPSNQKVTHAKSTGSEGCRSWQSQSLSSQGRCQDLGASLGQRVRLRRRVTWTRSLFLPDAHNCWAAAPRCVAMDLKWVSRNKVCEELCGMHMESH